MSIVNVPFAYTLWLQPKPGSGQDGVRPVVVWEAAPFEVPDAAPGDAPVAVTARGAAGETLAWRLHRGSLYQEGGAMTGGPGSHPLVPDWSPLRAGGRRPVHVSKVDLRLAEGGDRFDQMARTLEHAARCRVAGDLLLFPSPGPVVGLDAEACPWGYKKPSVRLGALASFAAPFLVTSGDRLDRLERFALDLLDLRGWEMDEMKEEVARLDVQVLVPGAIPEDFEADVLVRSAAHVFRDGLTNRMIATYPSGFLEGWLRYHEDGFDRGAASAEMAALLRAAGEAAEDIVSTDDTETRLRRHLRFAAWAAARWDDDGPAPDVEGARP